MQFVWHRTTVSLDYHRKKVEENPNWGVRLGLKFRNNILTLFTCCNVKFLAEIQAYVIILAWVFNLNSCNRVLSWSVIKDDKQEFKSQYIYIISTIPHGKCFVRYLRTRCFCIRNLTRSLRSLVRFLIRQQLVRKFRTPALSMKYSLYSPLVAKGAGFLAAKKDLHLALTS